MRTPKAKGVAASRASPSTCKLKGKAKEGNNKGASTPAKEGNNKGASTPIPQETESELKNSPNTRASAKQFKASDIDTERTSHLVHVDESKSTNKSRHVRKDPAGHRIAWAQFGEGVVQMISFRAGGLEHKVETWRKQNASSLGTVLQSVKKAHMTQSDSNICTEPDQGFDVLEEQGKVQEDVLDTGYVKELMPTNEDIQ
ncbi:hypothetical protein L7F22_057065, partial [Adiantum nelumboides]|nr:hypothetical protein [Adiantum nelumboides]